MSTRDLSLTLALLAAATGCRAAPVTLYVSPEGRDAWSGALAEVNATRDDGPLGSVHAARDAARRLRAAGATDEIEIILRGGVYSLAAPLVLSPEDSGVTFAAYPGERPVLSGGVTVSGWQANGDRTWSAPAPRDETGQVVAFNQLFVNGHRRTLARTPNYVAPGPQTPLGSTEGYFTVQGKAPPRRDEAAGRETDRQSLGFVYEPESIRRWDDLSDVRVVLYHSWENSRHPIADVDETNGIVTFTGPCVWNIFYFGQPQRYYVENAPDALDAPGEWYLDKRQGVVRTIALPGEDLATAEVVVPRLTNLVTLTGDANLGLWVEGITFRGLSFQYEDWVMEPGGHSDAQAVHTAPAAIMADGARGCLFEDCEIAHVGDYALWLREGCKDNRVVQCRIHDLGVGGPRIGVHYYPASDVVTSSGNEISNCHIYDGGHVYAGGVGVLLGQTFGNLISHNEIHDFNYTGISVGWTWGDDQTRCRDNVIEYNHVHHVMRRVLNDGGAIYTLGNSPGSVIRGNWFHDVWPWSAIGWGIYLDATTNGYLVENNLVYHTLAGGWMGANGTHENVIRNNVFALFGQYGLWPYWERRPNTFTNNIVYLDRGELFWEPSERFLRQRQAAGEPLGDWDSNVYWHTAISAGQDAAAPFDLRFYQLSFPEWQALGLDAHSLVADPEFMDIGGLDFRLRPTSPALKLGFVPFDYTRAGLQGDPDWVAEARAVQYTPTTFPPPPPPPAPEPVDDGFEVPMVGTTPERAIVSGEGLGASIRVTDETAASGLHSLKVTDAPGLEQPWQPHFFYQPHFTAGVMRQSFDIRLEPGALMYAEWRDDRVYPDNIGPSVTFDAQQGQTARVLVGGQTLAELPLSQWVSIEIEAELGQGTAKTWKLSLRIPEEEPRMIPGLSFSGKTFAELHWLGFVSTATDRAVFYLDNVKLQEAK